MQVTMRRLFALALLTSALTIGGLPGLTPAAHAAGSTDLSVVVTNVQASVEVGDAYIYRVAVTNAGVTATNPKVTINLPSTSLFGMRSWRQVSNHALAATVTGDATCDEAFILFFNQLPCTFPTLANGATKFIEIQGIANATGTLSTTATAAAGAGDTDPNSANNAQTRTATAVASTSSNAIRNDLQYVANTMAGTDNGSVTVALPFTVDWFGTPVSSVTISGNGGVGMGQAFDPWWDPASAGSNRVIALHGSDEYTLRSNEHKVQYGTGTVNGHTSFAVNWIYIGNAAADQAKSEYQLVLISRPDRGTNAFDIEMNFDHLRSTNGYAGFNPGNGDAATNLPGSGTIAVRDGDVSGGLRNKTFNAGGQLGRFVYNIDPYDPGAGSVDLRSDVYPSTDPMYVGSPAYYAVYVTNQASALHTATGVVSTTTFPASITPTGTSRPDDCTIAGQVVTCHLYDLGNGSADSFNIDVTPNVTAASASVSSTASSTNPEAAPSDNTASASVAIVGNEADLAASLSTTRDPLTRLDPEQYVATVTNNGPGAANDVQAVVTIPAGMAVTGVDDTTNCSIAGQVVTCDYDSIAAGYARVANIAVVPGSTATGTTASMTVSGADADPNATNDTAELLRDVIANSADVSMGIVASRSTMLAGETDWFELQTTNNGPATAHDIEVTYTVPAGLALTSIYDPWGACTSTGATVTCDYGDLGPGGYRWVVAYVTGTADATALANTVTVTSSADAVPANNSASVSVDVELGDADVAVALSADTNAMAAGEGHWFLVETTNSGPGTAVDVVTTATLPTAFAIDSLGDSTGTACEVTGQVVTCDYGTMGSSAYHYVYVYVHARAGVGSVSSTATVASGNDTNSTNDQASVAVVTSEGPVDLSVDVYPTRNPMVAGESEALYVYGWNESSNYATDEVTTVTVPAGLTITGTSDPAACTVAGQVVTCTQAVVQPNYYINGYYLYVTPTAAATGLAATANVDAHQAESDPGDDSDTATFDVVANTVDLSVSTQPARNPMVAGEADTIYFHAYNYGPAIGQDVVLTVTVPAGLTITALGDTTNCAWAGQVVTCEYDDASPGWVAYYQTISVIGSAPATDLTIESTIASGSSESSPTDNTHSSSAFDVVSNDVDLQAVATTGGRSTFVSGEADYFVLSAYNAGPAVAHDVTLTSTLPASLPYDLHYESVSGACSHAGLTVTCTFGDVAAGSSAWVQVHTVGGTPAEDVTVSATVATSSNDTDAGNATASFVADVLPAESDLVALVGEGRDPMIVGEADSITFVIQNEGPAVAQAPVLTGTVPAGLTIDAVSDPTNCTVAGQVVTCSYPAIAGSSWYWPYYSPYPAWMGGNICYCSYTASITVYVTPTAEATGVVATAAVDFGGTDPDASDDAASTTFDVIRNESDLEVSVSPQRSPMVVGEADTVHLSTRNLGPAVAHGVTLAATLPANLTITGTSNDGACTVSGQTVTCDAGDRPLIDYWGNYVFPADVYVVPNAVGDDLTVSATTSFGGVDPVPGNNTATTTLDILPDESDLSTQVFVSRPAMVVTEPDTIVAVADNLGPAIAEDVTLTVTVPSELTIDSISDTTRCSVSGQVVTCDLGDSNTWPGWGSWWWWTGYHHYGVQISVTPSAAVTGAEVASAISFGGVDPVAANDDASQTFDVLPIDADARASVSVSRDPMVIGEGDHLLLSFSNAGPAVAHASTLTHTVPAQLTIDSISDTTSCSVSGQDVTCSYGDVPPGQSRQVYVYVTPNAAAASVDVTADVSISNPELDGSNDAATATFTIAAFETDVTAETWVSRSSFVEGEGDWISARAANQGPAVAHDVTTTYTVDPVLAITSISNPTDCSVTGQVVTCTYGDLPRGSYRDLTVYVTPASAAPSTTSTFAVDSTTPETDTADDDATVSPEVLSDDADLSVGASLTRSTMVVGETDTLNLSLHNSGPAVAHGVVVSTTVASNLAIGTLYDPYGACSVSGQELTCSFGDVSAGDNRSASIAVTPTAPGTGLAHTVAVTSTSDDPVGANDTATASFDVVANEVDLWVDKSADRSPQVVDEAGWFEFNVHNDGPAVAHDVVLTDTVPAAWEVVGVAYENDGDGATNCTVAGQQLTCSWPALGVGYAAQVRLTVVPRVPSTVVSNVFQPYTNTASVSSASVERTGPGTHADSDATNVVILPVRVDLEAVVSVDQGATLVLGETGEVTMQVVNHGPAVAHGVTISSTFPTQLTPSAIASEPAPGACSIAGQTVTCAVGDVPSGSSATSVVTVTAAQLSPFVSGSYQSVNEAVHVASTSPEIPSEAYANDDIAPFFVIPDEVDLQANASTPPHGHLGTQQTYLFRAYNGDFGRADDVDLDADVPAAFAIDGLDAVTPGASCSIAGQHVHCDISSMPRFTYVDVNVLVTPMAVDPAAVSTVTVAAAGETDTVPGNNTATFTSKTSTPPTVAITVAPTSGVYPLTVTAHLAAFDADGDPLSYELWWGDGGFDGGAVPVSGDVSHTYNVDGLFAPYVRVHDGGPTFASDGGVVNVALAAPLVVDAGPDLATAHNDPHGVTLDASSSSPSAAIHTYSWHVTGTGGYDQTFTGKVVPLTGLAVGTYAAELTAVTNSTSATDTADIAIGPDAPGLQVHVLDEAGSAPIDGANVAVVSADGTQYAASSDGTGTATLLGLPAGTYTAYAAKYGYTPNEAEVVVTGGADEVTVTMHTGEIATATLEATRLTAEQAEAAGVDMNDPANYNVFEFTINLAFLLDQPPVTFTGYSSQGNGFINGSGWGGGGGGGGCGGSSCTIPGSAFGDGSIEVNVSIQYVQGVPQIIYMVIPVKAKWLKEFYDVTLTVQNLGSPGFVLTNGSAVLDLPDGLALPALFNQAQQNPQVFPDVPGGESRAVHWVVRGDDEGSYLLSAHYAGVLEPVGLPVTLDATLTKPIKVWGLSAVKVYVEADAHADHGEPYNIDVRLCNVTDSDPDEATSLYNLSYEYLEEGAAHFIYQGAQQKVYETSELLPGACLPSHLTVYPDFSGTFLPEYSFIKKKGGGITQYGGDYFTSRPGPTSVPNLSATRTATNVTLTWDPVAGDSNGYSVWVTKNVHYTAVGGGFDGWEMFPETPVTIVPAGQHTVTVPAPGDPSVSYSVRPIGLETKHPLADATFTGTPPVVDTDPVNTSALPGQSFTFTAAGSGDPTPTVQWEVSSDGGGSFTPIPGAQSTTYTATASLADHGKRFRAVFTSAAGSATSDAAVLSVAKGAVTITASSPTIVFGATVPAITFTATGQTAGFPITSPTCSSAAVTGAGTFPTSCAGPASDGTYTYTYVNGTLTATKKPTTATISVNPPTSAFGQSVTITAAVHATPPSTGSPAANVEIWDNGAFLVSVPMTGGVATFTTSALAGGSHSLVAKFNGGANFLASTSSAATATVGKGDTAIVLTSNNASPKWREPLTLTATVTSVAPASGTPSANVSFYDGATLLDTKPMVGGVATLVTTSLTVGSHSLTAVFAGSPNYNGSTSAPFAQSVGKAPTTTTVSTSLPTSNYSQAITITATVAAVAPSTGAPYSTVTFYDGGTAIGTASVSGGIATLTTASLTGGTHQLTATVKEGLNYLSSTSPPYTQTVIAGSTTTALTATPASTVFRQAVELTATVAPVAPATGTPTATVTFRDGATVLGTASTTGGVARLTVTTLAAGSHDLTATFGGGTNFTASTSPVVTKVVGKADTTAALTSSANPAVHGTSVTLTATIAAVAPSSGSPAASVVFKDGATTLATVSLVGGTATFTTSSLGVGTHNLTVTYAGGANFNGSSAALTQTIT